MTSGYIYQQELGLNLKESKAPEITCPIGIVIVNAGSNTAKE